eukprot:5799188-Pyramimonas_sp.AAC.1
MMTEDRELWAEEVDRYDVQSMTCDDSRARNRELVSTLRRHASQSTASVDNARFQTLLFCRRGAGSKQDGPVGPTASRVFSDMFNGLRPAPRVAGCLSDAHAEDGQTGYTATDAKPARRKCLC